MSGPRKKSYQVLQLSTFDNVFLESLGLWGHALHVNKVPRALPRCGTWSESNLNLFKGLLDYLTGFTS